MALVGGPTNDRLKAEITKRYGIRSLVGFDRTTQTVYPHHTYRFATVNELRTTLKQLEYYPLRKA